MLKFHHTGCLVYSIDNSIETYKNLFGAHSIGPKIFIKSQKVFVCFVNIGADIYIELVEPSSIDSSLFKFLNKGRDYYHKGFFVDDIEKTIIFLKNNGFILIDIFRSEAFDNKKCAFLISPLKIFFEIIEN
jgi:methylmalonyl-CoA/ethylmalonyl-CoA epimerase